MADVSSADLSAAGACAGLRGGAPGRHSVSSDLGRAHALTRYFGTETSPRAVDLRLADVLDTVAPSNPEIARAYAQAIPQACVAPAEEVALGPASVSLQGDVAVVRPGTGALDVPAAAKAIALDVRDLPDSVEARVAADAALAAIAARPLPSLASQDRVCDGHPDEVYGTVFGGPPVRGYSCRARSTTPGALAGTASLVRPLAVLTAPALTPLAAAIAVRLRVKAAATVIGADIHAAVAESTWVGIGTSGSRSARAGCSSRIRMPSEERFNRSRTSSLPINRPTIRSRHSKRGTRRSCHQASEGQ